MGTLKCDGCGEEFFIVHNSASMDTKLAERQAKRLKKVLAEEHGRDKKHPDQIELARLSTILIVAGKKCHSPTRVNECNCDVSTGIGAAWAKTSPSSK